MPGDPIGVACRPVHNPHTTKTTRKTVELVLSDRNCLYCSWPLMMIQCFRQLCCHVAQVCINFCWMFQGAFTSTVATARSQPGTSVTHSGTDLRLHGVRKISSCEMITTWQFYEKVTFLGWWVKTWPQDIMSSSSTNLKEFCASRQWLQNESRLGFFSKSIHTVDGFLKSGEHQLIW